MTVDTKIGGAPLPSKNKSPTRIAVLMTCFNRRARTLDCLRSLYRQVHLEDVAIRVFLVDDGSVDGTAEAVRAAFPDVNVTRADGQRFWNGGMRLAFQTASAERFDYFLWLNDDVTLRDDAISILLRTHAWCAGMGQVASIIVGGTRNPADGQTSYGGWRRARKGFGVRLEKIPVANRPIQCDTMNGNCVLLPASVVERVGELESRFTHGMGDFDYGLRAGYAGCSIWVAPEFVGDCVQNTGKGLWTDESLPVAERWRKLLGPKGIPPGEWFVYTRRHGGWLWPLLWISPYLKFWLRSARTGFVRMREDRRHST